MCSVMLLSSCHHDDPVEPRVRHSRQTILIYVAAENTLGSFFRADSLEIARALTTLPDTVQVALFIDNTTGSNLYYGSSKHELMRIKAYGRNVCSTDSTEMEMVLTDVFQYLPAEHYGLVFWSHASGWVPQNSKAPRRRTFGIDNGKRSSSDDSGPQMEITTMANILAHHPHSDFIFFDACHMQCIEVAYQLRHVTDWVAGSPAEIPADGAPYTLVLPYFACGDVGGAIKAYHDYYSTGAGQKEYGGAIVSAVRTDKLETLAQATKPIIASIFADRAEVSTSGVQYYFPQAYTGIWTQYFDIVSLFYRYCTTETFDAWRQVFDEAVPTQCISDYWASAASHWLLRVNDPAHCGAVSQYVPLEHYDKLGWNQAYHAYDWYADAGMNTTNW